MGLEGKGEERVSHGSELFMAADSKMITIGGGSVDLYTIITLQPAPSASQVPVGRVHGQEGRGGE